MKTIRVQDAIGHVLGHDVTKIVRGGAKGPRFRKGHIIKEEDIPELLAIGKEHVFVFELAEHELHENEAAEWIRDVIQTDHMSASAPKEGKIELRSQIDGLFLVDSAKLLAINLTQEIIVATRKSGPVKAGDKLVGTRIIPLVIDKGLLERFDQVVGGVSPIRVKPYQPKKLGIVTTGNEIYRGRIVDTFTPVLLEKFTDYPVEFVGHKTCPDDVGMIKQAILELKQQGADLILCTGGMSVDPDDVTPQAVIASGARLIRYGAPVLPGSMFMVAEFDDALVLGVPSCAMYHAITIFDIVLPYAMADEPITHEMIAALGDGGLCLDCEVCHYPNCQFGKGI